MEDTVKQGKDQRRTRQGTIFNPWDIEITTERLVVPSAHIRRITKRRTAEVGHDSDEEGAEMDVRVGRSTIYRTPADLASPHAHPSSSASCTGPAPAPSPLLPSPSEDVPLLGAAARLKRKRANERERRTARREEERVASGSKRKRVHEDRVAATPTLDVPNFKAADHDAPVASTGWQGLQDKHIRSKMERERKHGRASEDASESDDSDSEDEAIPDAREYQLDDPTFKDFRRFDWPGHPMRMEDQEGRCLAMLVGAPNDPDWATAVTEPATCLMEEASRSLYGDDGVPPTRRRGTHYAETIGAMAELVLWTLLLQLPFQRIVGHSDAVFDGHAGGLYRYYKKTRDKIHAWADRNKKYLPRLDKSVQGSYTFNFGPITATFPHIDFANLIWGWCFITALGRYDPDRGGHLVLWDLKLIIRFPPGTTIAIPSALLRHSNISIQAGETRMSFTQFSAAGLFRFVRNGFKTDTDLKGKRRRMSKRDKGALVKEQRERFAKGIRMWSKRGEAEYSGSE
ncbi:hypothetical protein MKEN_01471900 [Mycena kentingensis (nom. inval.)]|nr:hypothetical protein MKEN_01471900 [Mycena kentingensis (nom. inval.)]